MKVWIRNLTTGKEMEINLPMKEHRLRQILDERCEYIIIDCDVNIPEYANIYNLNELLQFCQDNEVEEEFEILMQTYLYHEVRTAMLNLEYLLIDFDTETAGWNCGSGGDFTQEWDKGRCLYEYGLAELPFEVKEEMEDYIDWSLVWRDSNCSGWREVTYKDRHYLVNV